MFINPKSVDGSKMLPNLSALSAHNERGREADVGMKRNQPGDPPRDGKGTIYTRTDADAKTIIDLDAGQRLTGEDYKKAKEIMDAKIDRIIFTWGVSLGVNKVNINNNHFHWNTGDGSKSYELRTTDPDRLFAIGRGKKAIQDARVKLRNMYNKDKDLFYTVMLALMTSGKVSPPYWEIE
jgi:hypothetical protein